MVEFAVVAPVLFTVIFACIEFTRFAMIRGLAEDAAYEAARCVVVPGATSAEATAEAQRIMGAMGIANLSVTITPLNGATTQGAIDDNTTEIRVVVSIPFSQNSLLVPRYFSGSTNIVARTTLFTERYYGDFTG